MIRSFLQKLLRKPVIAISNRYSSRPDKKRVESSLTNLYKKININPGKKGLKIEIGAEDKIVILSDQHKGIRDFSDDFALAEKNYLEALTYYNKEDYLYINLGDSEELWENLLEPVIKVNQATFEAEKAFLKRNAFVKVFGNHDLYWDNDPLASFNLSRIYDAKLKIYEGVILKATVEDKLLTFFLTHGHQGDLQSDGNWFSKWFISTIWAPLQAFLIINPNTPAFNDQLKSAHNRMMYEWSAKQHNTILITGHTHQPVFASLTYLERIYRKLGIAQKSADKEEIARLEEELKTRIRKGDIPPDFTSYKPNYFNSGCCCFDDGDITGIEIANGNIRLIKWEYNKEEIPQRIVLEETTLEALLEQDVNAVI